jgi:ribosomal protein L40E
MSTPLDGLKNSFFKFRKRKYALALGLILTFVLASLVLSFSYTVCFGYLITALIAYYVPYLFGLKDKRKLAVWGVVILFAISVPFGITYVNDQKSYQNDLLSTSDGSMTDGTVSPFYGGSDTVHSFSISVTNSSYNDVRVKIFDFWTNSEVVNASMTSETQNGVRLFTYNTTLQNNTEYAYFFVANDGQKWVATSGSDIGPIHASDVDMFVHWYPLLLTAVLLQVGALYFILIVLNWWTERSKQKILKRNEDLVKEKETYDKRNKGANADKVICSECGADVPMDAKACPQCGEKFEDTDDEELLCDKCGAKVKDSDKKCWNCGKQFEN